MPAVEVRVLYPWVAFARETKYTWMRTPLATSEQIIALGARTGGRPKTWLRAKKSPTWLLAQETAGDTTTTCSAPDGGGGEGAGGEGDGGGGDGGEGGGGGGGGGDVGVGGGGGGDTGGGGGGGGGEIVQFRMTP